jgi:hypothetical protein
MLIWFHCKNIKSSSDFHSKNSARSKFMGEYYAAKTSSISTRPVSPVDTETIPSGLPAMYLCSGWITRPLRWTMTFSFFLCLFQLVLFNCVVFLKHTISSTAITMECWIEPNHNYFYQCQGLLNICNKDWIDFIVRTLNPHQIFIQRIQRDQNLWENIMLPKYLPFKC